jgi:hypothetical protein
MVRRSDTNILAVKFNKLIEPSDVHTGDAVVCGNASCSAVLSHLSSVTDQEGKSDKVRGHHKYDFSPPCALYIRHFVKTLK